MSLLLSYDSALDLLLSNVPEPVKEVIPLNRSLGRVLASDIQSDLDLPPFDKALMDGFAVRSCDVAESPHRPLRIAGEVSAGKVPRFKVGPGECARIMTGAPLPSGSDAVQKVEESKILDSGLVELAASVVQGENVAPRAYEVRAGDTVLRIGQELGPAQVGVLATFGRDRVEVFGALSCFIIATGSELVEVEEKPGQAQIRNSNSYMLEAQGRRLALACQSAKILLDDQEETRKILESSTHFDVVVFSGGVSAGEKDFVHRVIKQSKGDVIFHKVAVKPGKPILFARLGRQMIFGLPGNPVSSFVTFELFVRPAVRKMMGFSRVQLPSCRAVLREDVSHKPGRRFFKPSRFRIVNDRPEVHPIKTRGSADLSAFAPANALTVVPEEVSAVKAGSLVEVLLLDQFFLEGNRA